MAQEVFGRFEQTDFEAGQYYLCIDSERTDTVITGNYYKFVRFTTFDKMVIINDQNKESDLYRNRFDVKSKRQNGDVTDRTVFTNAMFLIDFVKTEEAEYKTPSLYQYIGTSDTRFVIMAVSYNKSSGLLSGMVVDTDGKKYDIKDWESDWLASAFIQIKGEVTLKFV